MQYTLICVRQILAFTQGQDPDGWLMKNNMKKEDGVMKRKTRGKKRDSFSPAAGTSDAMD